MWSYNKLRSDWCDNFLRDFEITTHVTLQVHIRVLLMQLHCDLPCIIAGHCFITWYSAEWLGIEKLGKFLAERGYDSLLSKQVESNYHQPSRYTRENDILKACILQDFLRIHVFFFLSHPSKLQFWQYLYLGEHFSLQLGLLWS